MDVEPRVERRTTDGSGLVRTFLIADIRGYTTFTRERGDRDAARLAQKFADVARDCVEARSGEVIELRGDEALAVFASTEQAVRAALELQAACREETARDPELPLPVGVGIDVGEAVPVEDGFRGRPLNTAARLCSKATAGQVLVTRTAASACGDLEGIRFEARGAVELKGFDAPVELVEPVAPERPTVAAEPPPLTLEPLPEPLDAIAPLVGREHELRWLRGTWRQTVRGDGRLLFVSGPPGIGKTRLLSELAAQVHLSGTAVLYAGSGGAGTALALADLERIRTATAPTLLVVDDLEALGSRVVEALAETSRAIGDRPVLLVGLFRDATSNPALAEIVPEADRRGDGHRVLGLLGVDGIAEIARLYLGEEVDDAPLESMLRASGGVPSRVHEVVSDWARDEVNRRLAAAAEWLAEGRNKQAAELDFANNVIGLKLGRLYGMQTAPSELTDVCPYKGLATFEQEDAASFFGRERLVGELAARTVGAGMLGVVGPSGSGKSSVVLAGLLPSLAARLLPGSDRWRQVVIRPGDHPLRALGSALDGVSGEGRTVLVVDQFEELFTSTASEEERSAFVDALTSAAGDPDRAVVVLTIRADYYGHCAAYPRLAELIAANHVLVGPMTADELRRAIELPARRVGLRVESTLTEALVVEVLDEPGGLPLLSTTLVELWQARENGWLRMDAYERTGGVHGAVARLADASFDRLQGEQREAARAILLRLVAEGEGETAVRRRVPVSEFDRTPAVDAVLARFTEDRLITASDGTVEVAHEALIREWPRLRAWLEEDVQGRQIRAHITQTAKQWDERDRDQAELYRGTRLSVTLDWAARHGRELNELEREFLSRSREASEREAQRQRRTNRRLRGLLAGVAVFLVIALIAGGLALVQRSHARAAAGRAERAATVSLANSLGAEGLIQPRLDRALLQAREAVRLNLSDQTRSDLLATVLRSPDLLRELDFGDTGDRPQNVELSPDGKILAIPFNNGFVDFYDTSTLHRAARVTNMLGAPIAFAHHSPLAAGVAGGFRGDLQLIDTRTFTKAPLLRFDPKYEPYPVGGGGFGFSSDDRTLFVTFGASVSATRSDSVVDRYDVATGHLIARQLVEHQPQLWSSLSSDGSRLVVVDPTFTFVFNARTMRLEKRLRVSGSRSAALSPNGNELVFGEEDGSIRVVDLSTAKVIAASGGNTALVVGMAYTPDGSRLVTGGADGLVVVWDMTTNPPTVLTTLAGHGGQVHGAATDGRSIYTTSLDGTMFVWDLGGTRSFGHRFVAGTGDQISPQFSGAPQPYFGLSPDGHLLAAAQSDGDIALWDLTSAPFRRLRTIPVTPGSPITWTGFTPDGKMLLASGEGGQVLLIDPSTGSTRSFSGLHGPLNGIAMTGDGRLVAASDTTCAPPKGCAVHVAAWTAAIGRPARAPITFSFPGFPFIAGPPAFSPDGRLLTVPLGTGDIKAIDVRSWKAEHTLSGDVGVASFSPSGRILATTGGDGLVKLWNPRTWKQIGSSFQDSAGGGISLAFDPTGRLLVTGGTDATVRLFDLRDPTRVTPFGAPSFPTITGGDWVSAQFTHDGSELTVMDATGRAWVWPMRWQDWAAHACSVAARQLSRAEWSEFLEGRPYRRTCP